MEKTEECDLEGIKVLPFSEGIAHYQKSLSCGFDPTAPSIFIQHD